MASCTVAAIQMTSGADKSENLRVAAQLAEEAARRGAQLVALPELFNCLGAPEVITAQAEPIPGPTSTAMSRLAARLGVTLLAGSIAERREGSDLAFNASLLFSPTGGQLACYRKIHLFQADLPGGVSLDESTFMRPGDQLLVSPTPAGLLGQAACYDLRFPELFRRLVDAGAQTFAIPSAFTLETGRDHWEILLRARAIENLAYVIAPNQFGRHSATLRTYGRSMIIDPWGIPLAVAPDGPSVICAEIDLDRVIETRARMPALANRRNPDSWTIGGQTT